MLKAAQDRLLDFTERHAHEIAASWWKAVSTNQHTKSYHSLSEKQCLPQAVTFYKNLRPIYESEKPYEAGLDYYIKNARERYQEGIPLEEAIYAIVLMRRQMWLYAEFQALFASALDMQQAIESINRTVLITDYAIHILAEEYFKLSCKVS